MKNILINIIQCLLLLLSFICFGQKHDSASIKKFSYLTCCLQESIRLNPLDIKIKPDYYKSEIFINSNIAQQKTNAGSFTTPRTLYNPYGTNSNLGKYMRVIIPSNDKVNY
ncbi:hypothetical protein C7V10_11235 [Elizabethkingia miricola]|nr:hypothetical protein C7V10_11235 [Elizabethkingia miricola]